MNEVFRRLSQPTGIRALLGLSALAGVSIAPELQSQIITGAGIAWGIWEALRDEAKPTS